MWLGGISCQSVLGMILQWGSTLKVSIELPATSRHHRRRDMTERLLKATLSPNQTNKLIHRHIRKQMQYTSQALTSKKRANGHSASTTLLNTRVDLHYLLLIEYSLTSMLMSLKNSPKCLTQNLILCLSRLHRENPIRISMYISYYLNHSAFKWCQRNKDINNYFFYFFLFCKHENALVYGLFDAVELLLIPAL